MKEQTALRPKPMPGREPGTFDTEPDLARRRRTPRRRRLVTVLLGVLAAALLLLAGVGLGTVGATVTGMAGLAELRHQAPPAPPPAPRAAAPSPLRSPTLGVEAVDDEKPGALVVAVHVPGPGYTAGLVRGDVLLAVGTTRVDTAADLAHAVSRTLPGREIRLTVRHKSGAYQQLTAVPGVMT